MLRTPNQRTTHRGFSDTYTPPLDSTSLWCGEAWSVCCAATTVEHTRSQRKSRFSCWAKLEGQHLRYRLRLYLLYLFWELDSWIPSSSGGFERVLKDKPKPTLIIRRSECSDHVLEGPTHLVGVLNTKSWILRYQVSCQKLQMTHIKICYSNDCAV